MTPRTRREVRTREVLRNRTLEFRRFVFKFIRRDVPSRAARGARSRRCLRDLGRPNIPVTVRGLAPSRPGGAARRGEGDEEQPPCNRGGQPGGKTHGGTQ